MTAFHRHPRPPLRAWGALMRHTGLRCLSSQCLSRHRGTPPPQACMGRWGLTPHLRICFRFQWGERAIGDLKHSHPSPRGGGPSPTLPPPPPSLLYQSPPQGKGLAARSCPAASWEPAISLFHTPFSNRSSLLSSVDTTPTFHDYRLLIDLPLDQPASPPRGSSRKTLPPPVGLHLPPPPCVCPNHTGKFWYPHWNLVVHFSAIILLPAVTFATAQNLPPLDTPPPRGNPKLAWHVAGALPLFPKVLTHNLSRFITQVNPSNIRSVFSW